MPDFRVFRKLIVSGDCLAPLLVDGVEIDSVVDFDLEEIDIGDYVAFNFVSNLNLKRVIGISGQSIVATEKTVTVASKEYVFFKKSLVNKMNGYPIVPPNCIVVADDHGLIHDHISIVHKENFVSWIPFSFVYK